MTTRSVKRRTVLRLSLAAAPLWLAQQRSALADDPGRGGGSDLLSWDEFIAEATRAAEALYTDASPQGQDAYLFRVASIAARLGEKPAPDMSGVTGAAFYTFGMAHVGRPFFVVHWRMEPDTVYPAHNHPDYSVCTLSLDGETVIENYEVDGDAPAFDSGSRELFRIRQTKRDVLTAGDMNTLSATRNNIHLLRAGARGAEGIDITTAYTRSAAFSFLQLEGGLVEQPGASSRRARWVGPSAAPALLGL